MIVVVTVVTVVTRHDDRRSEMGARAHVALKSAQLTAHEKFARDHATQDVVVRRAFDEEITPDPDVGVGLASNVDLVDPESRVRRLGPERSRVRRRDVRPVIRPSALRRKLSKLDRVVVTVVVVTPDLTQEFGKTHGAELVAHLGRENAVERPRARLGSQTKRRGVAVPGTRDVASGGYRHAVSFGSLASDDLVVLRGARAFRRDVVRGVRRVR